MPQQVIVIDNGSSRTRAGFAGDGAPRVDVPSVVGTRIRRIGQRVDTGREYVADETDTVRGIIRLSFPINRGIITDWDNMEKVWHRIFYSSLAVNPEEYSVILTEVPLNSKAARQRMKRIMFETFNISALYIEIQAVLALYASARTTGVVLDIGDGVTHVVPIYEGEPIHYAVSAGNVAGSQLTDSLNNLLTLKGFSFTTRHETEIVRDIKEKLCFVAFDYETERQGSKILSKSYELPDGNILQLTSERITCTEALFQPSLIGKDTEGVHQLVFDTVMNCDCSTRTSLFRNVVLTGGGTMFHGLASRLKNELVALAPFKVAIRVIAPSNRNIGVWIGGSIVGALPVFQSLKVSREQYFNSRNSESG